MKTLRILICLLAFSFHTFAQTPNQFSYQAALRDGSGNIIANQQVTVIVSIHKGAADGTSVFTETHNVTTTANGIINLSIGSLADLDVIEWGVYSCFVKITVNGTEMGASELLSVPYAIQAKDAETLSGTISESQISDLKPYLTSYTETDPVFAAWNKSTGISITESQISDFKNYIVTENDPAVAANFNFSGASAGDLLQYNGTKWVKLTPSYLTSYTETQNLADVIAINNSANAQIKNVTNPTEAQDAATKAYVDVLLSRIEALEESFLLSNGFIDPRDGNHYNVVKIGNQIWMAENSKYLPIVNNPSTGSEGLPNYYVYNYNGTVVAEAKATTYYNTYGVLYNWPAAMINACPTGWHLPSDAEWSQLITYLGGASVAAGKLKATGTTHWASPNTGATNETGFTALPAGTRNYDGVFGYIGITGFWWCSTESSANNAWYRHVNSSSTTVTRISKTKELGFSVRCIKN